MRGHELEVDLWQGAGSLSQALTWLATLIVALLTLGNLAVNVAVLGNRDNACTCLEGVTTLHTATQQQRYTNSSTVTTTTTDVSITTNQTVDARTFRNVTTNVTVEQYYTVNDTTTTVTYVNETQEYGETIDMQTIYLNSNTSAQTIDPFVNRTRITATTHQNDTRLANGTEHAQTLEVTNSGSRAVEVQTNQATAVLESPSSALGLHSVSLLWDADDDRWVSVDGTTAPVWAVAGTSESSKLVPASGGRYGWGVGCNHDCSMVTSSSFLAASDEAVYVHETDASGIRWGLRTKIQVSAGSNWNFGYGPTLTPDGVRLATGAPQRSPHAIWVFRRDGLGVWATEMNALQCTGASTSPLAYCGFHNAFNVDGNILMSSCPDHNNVGAVCMFKRTGTSWSFAGLSAVPSGYRTWNGFGGAYAMDGAGRRVVIGAERLSDNTISVIEWKIGLDGSPSSPTVYDTGSGNIGSSYLHSHLSLDGTRLLVGCGGCTGGTPGSPGQAYIFNWNNARNTWTSNTQVIEAPHDAKTATLFSQHPGMSGTGHQICAGSSGHDTDGGMWCYHYSPASRRFKLTTAVVVPPGLSGGATCARWITISADGRRITLACDGDGSSGSIFVIE